MATKALMKGQRVILTGYDPFDAPMLLQSKMCKKVKVTGRIIDINTRGWVRIQFDKFMGGHDGSGTGKDGYCWSVKVKYVKAYVISNYGLEDDV